MNLAMVYNDARFWSPGAFLMKVFSQQPEISILAHPRIPEDLGIVEEQNNLNLDLILIVDSAVMYKMNHHKGKLGHAKTCIWLSDTHRDDWWSTRKDMITWFHYDYIFYAQKNAKEKILKCGYDENSIFWLPHAFDPEIFHPMPWIEKLYSCGYVGFKNDKRIQVEEALKNQIDFKHFTTVWAWQANRKLNELKTCINTPVTDDVLNMRHFETLGAKVPLILENIKGNGLEDLFTPDMYRTYDSPNDIKDIVMDIINNPEQTKEMVDKAYMNVCQNHSYRNRANSLLAQCGFPMLTNIPQ